MKKAFAALLIATLAGCASNTAVLPSLEGKPRLKINAAQPVETQAATAAPVVTSAPAKTFDFVFQGDILDGLAALNALQPQMNLLPPLGKPAPFTVSVNLRPATLETALRSMGEQGGKDFDLILNKSKAQGGNQVLIRFNSPKE